MSVWRAPFETASRRFAAVSETLRASGAPRPVLVGGAAGEYWSGSMVATGDFDLCSPVRPEPESALRHHGFVKPSGPGTATRGGVHPDLAPGFGIVGSMPFDALADSDHVF